MIARKSRPRKSRASKKHTKAHAQRVKNALDGGSTSKWKFAHLGVSYSLTKALDARGDWKRVYKYILTHNPSYLDDLTSDFYHPAADSILLSEIEAQCRNFDDHLMPTLSGKLQEGCGSPAESNLYTLAHRFGLLARATARFDLWHVVVNYRPGEVFNSIITRLEQCIGKESLWIGVEVPDPAGTEPAHLHLLVALPAYGLAKIVADNKQIDDANTGRRGRKRGLRPLPLTSLHQFITGRNKTSGIKNANHAGSAYHLDGLAAYFALGKNLGVKGAAVRACRAVRSREWGKIAMPTRRKGNWTLTRDQLRGLYPAAKVSERAFDTQIAVIADQGFGTSFRKTVWGGPGFPAWYARRLTEHEAEALAYVAGPKLPIAASGPVVEMHRPSPPPKTTR